MYLTVSIFLFDSLKSTESILVSKPFFSSSSESSRTCLGNNALSAIKKIFLLFVHKFNSFGRESTILWPTIIL